MKISQKLLRMLIEQIITEDAVTMQLGFWISPDDVVHKLVVNQLHNDAAAELLGWNRKYKNSFGIPLFRHKGGPEGLNAEQTYLGMGAIKLRIYNGTLYATMRTVNTKNLDKIIDFMSERNFNSGGDIIIVKSVDADDEMYTRMKISHFVELADKPKKIENMMEPFVG